jgi:hypothetical protein
MLRALAFVFLLATAGAARAQDSSVIIPWTGTPPTCPNSTNSTLDGCASAQANGTTLQSAYSYPSVATAKQVVWLNILQGSGYTNGTYSWSSTGGGCSAQASGTVTVSGGKITAYAISVNGSGCTSRPTIAIPSGAGSGTGAEMITTVYQVTPHTEGATWSEAGVDFPVGVDAVDNVITVAPTGLPGCAAVSGHTVNITSNCSVSNIDFRGGGTPYYVNVNCTGCTVTFKNDYFEEPTAENAGLNIGGSGETVTVSDFECTSQGATLGGTAPSNDEACVDSADASGTIELDHFYIHDTWSKGVNFKGTNHAGGLSSSRTEWAGLFVDTCLTSNGPHGESEYQYTGDASVQLQSISHYVMYLNRWHIGQVLTTNTANAAGLQADDTTITNGSEMDHNLFLAPGPWLPTGGDNSNMPGPWTGSATDFIGVQEGGSYTGSLAESNLIIDYTGVYFPWNHGNYSGGITFANNLNAVTGNSCTIGTCN